MDGNRSLGLLGFLALVALNALISAAHSALINARKSQIREQAEAGNAAAKRVLKISENATRLLASRQFMSISLHFCAAGLLTALNAVPLSEDLIRNGADVTAARVVVFLLTWVLSAIAMTIFGELIPDAIASGQPEQLAMFAGRFMQPLLGAISPVTRLMMWISTRLAAPFGSRSYVTEEEIMTIVDAANEEGVIEDEEKEMIDSIFSFGDKVVREVMIPRIDVSALEANTTLSRAVDLVLSSGHSRIPIYEETIDKVIGLIYAKDLLGILKRGQGLDRHVRAIMRPAYFVPESKKAGALLEELQQRKIHMAIVIDEYGGTAGVVTIEDLLEEIVGDIMDEYDPEEEAEYEQINENEFVFDAGINLTEVNDLMEVDLPTEDSDTLGGFVFSTLDKVPLLGESFTVDRLEITVESITGRRIRKVRVRRLPPVAEPDPKTDRETREAKAGERTQEIRAVERPDAEVQPKQEPKDL